jgi:hypothetical protein
MTDMLNVAPFGDDLEVDDPDNNIDLGDLGRLSSGGGGGGNSGNSGGGGGDDD